MHQQCVEDFERDICYDEDRGKVMDTFYCHVHHPKKDLIESTLDGGDSVIGAEGEKKDTQSAVDPKSPSILSPKNKQPKPIVCVWNNCPSPHKGQMIVCSEDGFGATNSQTVLV